MAWTARKLTPRFGVALDGLNVAAGVSEVECEQLRAAVYEYGIVLLPGQSVDDDALFEFAEAMGEILHAPNVTGVPASRVLALTNLDENGNLRSADDVWVKRNQANVQWHADMTFTRPRASISILHGRIVTTENGNTEFCDMRLGWESLAATEQAELASLTAVHTLWQSRRKTGTDKGFNEDDRRRYPPVERPLVERHAPSGRTALMLGSSIASVGRLDETESAAFLAELTARTTPPAHVYSHRWTAGDLLLWDNRCVLHRATDYDVATQPRDLRAVRLYEAADT
jgi:alpha-ketoglutarate-dependent 2,4-dichlorophenoxyacetate dioxygenase